MKNVLLLVLCLSLFACHDSGKKEKPNMTSHGYDPINSAESPPK